MTMNYELRTYDDLPPMEVLSDVLY